MKRRERETLRYSKTHKIWTTTQLQAEFPFEGSKKRSDSPIIVHNTYQEHILLWDDTQKKMHSSSRIFLIIVVPPVNREIPPLSLHPPPFPCNAMKCRLTRRHCWDSREGRKAKTVLLSENPKRGRCRIIQKRFLPFFPAYQMPFEFIYYR